MNFIKAATGLILALVLTIACIIAVSWWLSISPDHEIKLRLALESHESTAQDPIDIKGQFAKFDGTPSSIKNVWSGFRGPNHDNISPESIKLIDSWSEEGPPLLWSIDLGEGYAGPAVMNGCVYLLDYDEKEKADSLRCFSLDDGKEIWRRWYKIKIKRNHGMSRTVPAVTDKYVVTIGPKCQVMCNDAITGDFLWGIDLPKEYKTKVPLWYTGQCPLIDNNIAVIATGGDALMVGLDCATGEVKWKTPNPKNWKMSHSSIMPITIAGKKMYIYCFAGGMAGISAEPNDIGTLLWETTDWNHSVMAPSPIPVGNNKIFITAGYGSGSMLLEIKESAGKFSAKQLKSFTKKEFACEQHTPIYYKDHLFTVMPADAGALKLQAVCMTPDGEVSWTSGKDQRFGIGPYLIADNKMFILRTDGTLTMAKANTDKYEHIATYRPLKGHDAWGPMAIVDGKLLLRDFRKLICLNLKDK